LITEIYSRQQHHIYCMCD